MSSSPALSALSFLSLSLFLFTPMPSPAEVEMGANICVNAGDPLGVLYKNNTPDTWDMRGFGMTLGGTRVAGRFSSGASGSYLVPPGGTGSVLYAGCGGQRGKPNHRQLEAKVGTCNEPEPPRTYAPLTCDGIDAPASYYEAALCLSDGLGVNRGAGYGGFFDSREGQTQIQIAATGLFNADGKRVRFEPESMGGPFYLMSMAAIQEYLQVDMQVLLALGAEQSGAGLVDSGGASLYNPPANTGLDTSPYGPFRTTYQTALGRLYKDYPRYFAGAPALEKLISTGGSGITQANAPQQVNAGLLAALNLWWHFDGLKAAQDLCFTQFLRQTADKSAGVKLLLSGWFIGPNLVDQGTSMDDYATHVLPASFAVLDAADVTPFMKKFPWGLGTPDHNTHNHIVDVFAHLNPIVAATSQSTACGGALPIYDADLSLTQVRELFFGQAGTVAAQGHGGLLWHFAIPAASRQALWTDLQCAFGRLQGKAPGRAADAISFRYDFLSLLRVARGHLVGYGDKFRDPPKPIDTYSSEYAIWVVSHSRNPCRVVTQDAVFPALTLADSALRKGDKVEGSATDNVGIQSREFTTDKDWRAWRTTNAAFTVPITLPDSGRLWYRVTDSCGNAVIEEVPLAEGPTALSLASRDPQSLELRARRGARADGVLLEGAGDRVVKGIAAFDAQGVFVGWARSDGSSGQWQLPRTGTLALEVRWQDGSRSRTAIR